MEIQLDEFNLFRTMFKAYKQNKHENITVLPAMSDSELIFCLQRLS